MADIKEVQKQLDAALAENKELKAIATDFDNQIVALKKSNELLTEEKDILMKSLSEASDTAKDLAVENEALKAEVARLIATPDEKEGESGVGGVFELGGSKYQVLVPSYNIPGFGVMSANDVLADAAAQAVLVKSGSGLIKAVK